MPEYALTSNAIPLQPNTADRFDCCKQSLPPHHSRSYCLFACLVSLVFLPFLPFTARHQKRGVASPSLNSPQRSEGDGRCWANLQNTHFSGLTRKNAVFKRSVLKYVSINKRSMTPSRQKSRVCVNQPDRLLHPIHACLFCPSGTRFRPPAKLGRLRDAG